MEKQSSKENKAIHPRHLHIQGQNIRIQFKYLVARNIGVARCPYDFYLGIVTEGFNNGSSDHRRIVDDQDANLGRGAHGMFMYLSIRTNDSRALISIRSTLSAVS